MTIQDLLILAAGEPAKALRAGLDALKAKFPDAAPEVDAVESALTTVLDPAALAALGKTVTGELGDIAQGKFSGAFHPSDLG